MIYDSIANLKNYATVVPMMDDVLAFLAANDIAALKPGRIEIVPDKLFANVDEYDTTDNDVDNFELHRQFIDIQVVADGDGEDCAVPVPGAKLETTKEYRPDVMFVHSCDFVKIRLAKGNFAVFFPYVDPHHPAVASGNPAHVKKVIFKILTE